MKKILLPLTAVAAFAVIAAANIKIAAALAIMIVFFSGIFATLPRLMEFQDRLEIRRWKKRLEENEKRKERIAKICREVPQILSSGFFVFKVNHRRDYRTCRFERTVLLYGQ